MWITTKGQITVPARLREKKGFLPHTQVEFVEDGDDVKLVKIGTAPRRGKAFVEHLRGKGDVAMSTDEIMALTRGEA